MPGPEVNKSHYDPATASPSERIHATGRTIEHLTPEGLHFITLIPDSDPDHPTLITHEPMKYGSNFLFSNSQPTHNGQMYIVESEDGGLLRFAGVDETGSPVELFLSFKMDLLETLEGQPKPVQIFEEWLKPDQNAGVLKQSSLATLMKIYETSQQIRQNKPHYSFSTLQTFATPLQSLGIVRSEADPTS